MNQFRDLYLRHGPSPEVASFIQRERITCFDLCDILEETFRRVDLGPRHLICRQGAYVSPEVEFLLIRGAFFDPGRCDINKLLEDTHRYIELGPWEFKRRAGACFSPEVDFLLREGANFKRAPSGLHQIVEDTKAYLQQSDKKRIFFFNKPHTTTYIGAGILFFSKFTNLTLRLSIMRL
jgi:hypothetical protein